MSVDILGTSCDQCRSMVQYSFTSTETRRLVRTDSPGRPPRLSYSSWTMTYCCCWSLLYSAILCSPALTVHLSHVILNEWLWLLIEHFKYPLKLCTYSAVCLLHSWCHVKLLLTQQKFCVHHATMHHVKSLHAKPHVLGACIVDCLYIGLFSAWADSLHLQVILHEWIAFY